MHEEKESVKQTNKPKTLLEFRAKRAVRLLEEQIAVIQGVQSWAKEAGVSRRWLCKSMKAVYGLLPKIILREMKYEKVVRLFREQGLETGCYSVDVDAGFRNAAALSKFLSTFYETNYTDLKLEILNGEVLVASTWLNRLYK